MRKNSLIIVFFLFLLLGCTSEMDKRVETVLSISGSNRTELEAVLDHYKHEPQKLKAAKFLIANMRYHHSFYSLRNPRQHPLLDSLTRAADSLFYHSVYVATDSFHNGNIQKLIDSVDSENRMMSEYQSNLSKRFGKKIMILIGSQPSN